MRHRPCPAGPACVRTSVLWTVARRRQAAAPPRHTRAAQAAAAAAPHRNARAWPWQGSHAPQNWSVFRRRRLIFLAPGRPHVPGSSAILTRRRDGQARQKQHRKSRVHQLRARARRQFVITNTHYCCRCRANHGKFEPILCALLHINMITIVGCVRRLGLSPAMSDCSELRC